MDALASAIIRTLKYTTIGEVHPVLGTRCHLWTGAADEHGYGRIGVDGGKVALATHVALQLAGFSLAPDHGALHHCDTPACVNTDDGHIYGGTQAENSRDMMRRGRGRGQFVSRP